MSHIKRETVLDISGVSSEIVGEGLQIVAALLEMQGWNIWKGGSSPRKDLFHEGLSIGYRWEAEEAWRAMQQGRCVVGLRGGKKVLAFLNGQGRLEFIAAHGSSQDDALVAPLKEFQDCVEQALPGAVYFAARAALARSQGKRVEVRANPETRQLQLAVEV